MPYKVPTSLYKSCIASSLSRRVITGQLGPGSNGKTSIFLWSASLSQQSDAVLLHQLMQSSWFHQFTFSSEGDIRASALQSWRSQTEEDWQRHISVAGHFKSNLVFPWPDWFHITFLLFQYLCRRCNRFLDNVFSFFHTRFSFNPTTSSEAKH